VPWNALSGCTDAVCAALDEVLSGRPADRVIDRLLRAHRSWTPAQRTAAVEAVFGVSLWRRRLAWQLGGLPLGPRALLFSLLRDLSGLPPDQAAALAGLPAAGPLPSVREPPATLADRCSLPDWLADTITRELAAEAFAFAEALNVPGPICLRANLSRTSAPALAARLATEGVRTRPGAFAATCLVVEGERPNILALEAYREGLFEVQDEGSQLLGALLEIARGDSVLDLCAGAGGKTLQLASLLGPSGRVHAFDSDASKLERLRHRASRAGADAVSIHAGGLPAGLRVDSVLVDAPCSELGALRRGPDLRFRMAPESFLALPSLQLELLETALAHLRSGGRLVYATCTFRREENQDVALELERRHPSLERQRPGQGWLADDLVRDGFFTCLPHRHGTDGFFAAVYRLR
jgi:16S rRNA (cytosine967-C5)-methyltransferase